MARTDTASARQCYQPHKSYLQP